MKPLLSICCTTFNHEKFVDQTINGFLIQQTNFPIEIIIHDDASTDNTAAIIKKYAAKDDRIVTILQTENQYSQNIKPWANYVFPKTKGKYIALCEGDDYWTDPLKLQKQVDFLEAHPDYGMSFHNSKVFIQETESIEPDYLKGEVPETTTILDLANRNYIRTNTVVLRNDFELPDWFSLLPVGDWPLFLIQIKDSKIKKFDEEMGVYRIHNNGVWTSIDKKKMITMSLNTIKPILESNILSKAASKVLKKRYDKYRFKLFKENIRQKFKSK
ncbi:MAG: glycosyltransferase [Gelidibacter sp.]|nr:glycosyltransferase [Gelidibacter sp.]